MTAWDVSTVEGATLEINGSITSINVGDNFKDIVIQAANNAGYSKFRVFLNGEEIEPVDCPTLVSAGDKIKVMPYDKPAVIG